MAFVDAAIAVGSAVGLEGTAAAIGGGALMAGGAGALAGGLYNGLTGRSVLNGALIGGAIGGIGGGLAGFGMAPGFAATADATAVGMGYSSAAEAIAANPANATLLGFPAGTTAAQAAAMGGQASAGFMGSGMGPGVAGGIPTTGPNALEIPGYTYNGYTGVGINPATETGGINAYNPTGTGLNPQRYADASLISPAASTAPTTAVAPYDPMQASQEGYVLNPSTPQAPGLNTTSTFKTPSLFSGISNFVKEHPYATAAGVGGIGYLLGGGGRSFMKPNYLPTYTPPTAASYGLGRTLSSSYMPTRPMAKGGIASLADGGLLQNGPAQVNFMGNDMYPQSQIHRSYYATPTQMPTSAQQTAASYEPKTNPLTGELTANMAIGGLTAAGETGLQATPQTMNPMYIQQLANQYQTTPQAAQQGLSQLHSVGNILGGSLPGVAAAAKGGMVPHMKEGSFVVPADVVSHIGNGSTDAGFKTLQKHFGATPIKGSGDGMSDDISTTIGGKQPARVADGEALIDPEYVKKIGNGSVDAGAKHLYKMMDNVRKARTGRKSQGKQIKADKYLPK